MLRRRVAVLALTLVAAFGLSPVASAHAASDCIGIGNTYIICI